MKKERHYKLNETFDIPVEGGLEIKKAGLNIATKNGELKLTVHIYKDLITAIDTELFIDGAWEKAIAPKNSPMKDMYPGWYYVMPITFDTQLHIKMMMKGRTLRGHTKKVRRKGVN
jgi:hypothetical protein